MLVEVTSIQFLCLRMSQLIVSPKMTPGIAALAKMHTCLKARQVLADARDLLGGNGILLEYHDLEGCKTILFLTRRLLPSVCRPLEHFTHIF